MLSTSRRTKGILIALLLLASATPLGLPDGGDAAECEPVCDFCHYAHDRVYHAYLDIVAFQAPSTLDGADTGQVEVRLRLHGNVELGYTTISRGWLELTANGDLVGIKHPKQDFISFEPGFRSFFWDVSGRLEGVDTLHVQVYAIGVHLSVEFWEEADSAPITVTNPVNAPPRISFIQPDGFDDTATNSYTLVLDLDDPNADHLRVDFYYDTDTDPANGRTLFSQDVIDPSTYAWNTVGIPDGWYWIHLEFDDQRGGTGKATSGYPIIVSHMNHVPNVELSDPPRFIGTPGTLPVVRDPVFDFKWFAMDDDGDPLTFEFYVGRDVDHMELVATTAQKHLEYAPPDNARLYWMVLPHDGKIKGWCRDGPSAFRTDIRYPVEVDLVLPANGAVVPGPNVKLVWYGRDLDFEQVLYDVFLERNGNVTRVVNDWDDPAGPVLVVPDLEPGETYTWWVTGDNPLSSMGTSERWSFTVAETGLPVVDLQPEDIADQVVTISWSLSTIGTVPVAFDVHLVDRVLGDVVVLDNTTMTSLTLFDLVEDTTYHWYVVPVDLAGREGYSVPAFRTFTWDTNAPPEAIVTDPVVQVPAGRHVLRWGVMDADGDDVTFDIYLDAFNGTTLIAADLSATQLAVDLEPDLTYRWRVIARDAHGAGPAAGGIVVTEAMGSGTAASGSLTSPPDGATVTGPVVNLTWSASDPLSRVLLFDLHVDQEGGDPLALPPITVNVTATFWLLELNVTAEEVSWGIVVRPVRGPATLLGKAGFQVIDDEAVAPVARLAAGGRPVAAPARGKALEAISLDGSASIDHGRGYLEYWFDFGDGTASGWTNASSIEHTYLKEGNYTATLVVRDVTGLGSEPASVTIDVGPAKLTSDEDVPGPGGAGSVLALLLGALVLIAARMGPVRGRQRNGGGP